MTATTSLPGAQYSLRKILLLWALVAVPMGLARFVVMPRLADTTSLPPGITYWWLMILGMAWQFVLSMLLLRGELKSWSWAALRERLWLQAPRDPSTGTRTMLAYWLTIPIIVYVFLIESSGVFGFVEEWAVTHWPALQPPAYTQIHELEPLARQGAWYVLGIALVSSAFNYLLGEELFFRGVLLPRMNGALGRWDWAANGLLFAAYHVHMIEQVPQFLVGSLFYGYLNKRYRSFYPGLIIHGVEGVVLIGSITLLLLAGA